MSKIILSTLVIFISLAACSSDQAPNSPDAKNNNSAESKVVKCYGQGCPHDTCDESQMQGDCDPYDDADYNVTNSSTLCEQSSSSSYCLVNSTRNDGEYEFGKVQYWFIDCDNGVGDADICINNGCEATNGCS